MPLSSDVQSKRCLEVRIIIKHASGKLIEIASSRHPERRQQWRIHLACLTHKLFLNIKVQYFSCYFPYYSLLDLAQAINNYAGLKGFVVLCGTEQLHMIEKMHKNSTNMYFLPTYGKDNELSCIPSISTCGVETPRAPNKLETGELSYLELHIRYFFPL